MKYGADINKVWLATRARKSTLVLNILTVSLTGPFFWSVS